MDTTDKGIKPQERQQLSMSQNNSLFCNLRILHNIFFRGMTESKKRTSIKNCVVLECAMLALSSLVPSFLCTFAALCGWDCNLIVIGIMVVYAAFLINEKEKKVVDQQNLAHVAVWTRFGVLVTAYFISTTGSPKSNSVKLRESMLLTPIHLYFLTLKFLSMYRMYVSFFKAVAVTVRQMKPANNSEIPKEKKN